MMSPNCLGSVRRPSALTESCCAVTSGRSASAPPLHAKLSVKFAGCGHPVKGNIGDVGYYRVQYSDDDLKLLTAGYKPHVHYPAVIHHHAYPAPGGERCACGDENCKEG